MNEVVVGLLRIINEVYEFGKLLHSLFIRQPGSSSFGCRSGPMLLNVDSEAGRSLQQ